MTKSYFLYGNLTLDHNYINGRKYSGMGGSVYFTAKILKNVDEKVVLYTCYGKDLPLKSLTGVDIIPSKPTSSKSLVFKNIYHGSIRKQIVDNYQTAHC